MSVNIKTIGQSGNVYLTPYKSYIALLSQSGTDAPTAVVMNSSDSNYLGNIVWSYVSTGFYLGTLTGLFTAGKTFFAIHNNRDKNTSYVLCEDNFPDTISIEVAVFSAGAFNNINDSMNSVPVEIRVYP